MDRPDDPIYLRIAYPWPLHESPVPRQNPQTMAHLGEDKKETQPLTPDISPISSLPCSELPLYLTKTAWQVYPLPEEQ